MLPDVGCSSDEEKGQGGFAKGGRLKEEYSRMESGIVVGLG